MVRGIYVRFPLLSSTQAGAQNVARPVDNTNCWIVYNWKINYRYAPTSLPLQSDWVQARRPTARRRCYLQPWTCM